MEEFLSKGPDRVTIRGHSISTELSLEVTKLSEGVIKLSEDRKFYPQMVPFRSLIFIHMDILEEII